MKKEILESLQDFAMCVAYLAQCVSSFIGPDEAMKIVESSQKLINEIDKELE